MSGINAYQHVFPIVGGNNADDGKTLVIRQVFGTAFPIGGEFWLTAAHVVRQAAKESTAGLGFARDGIWQAASIQRSEVKENFDVAILEVRGVEGSAVRWANTVLPMSDEVVTVGFPYALTHDLPGITIRSFRGHITASVTTTQLLAKPRVYELQFQCPRGLSGAPLFHTARNMAVAGVIIGNAVTQMLILSDREVLVDGTTTIVERYEQLQLGIAIQSTSLLPLHFDILGGTLVDHLTKHKLM